MPFAAATTNGLHRFRACPMNGKRGKDSAETD